MKTATITENTTLLTFKSGTVSIQSRFGFFAQTERVLSGDEHTMKCEDSFRVGMSIPSIFS